MVEKYLSGLLQMNSHFSINGETFVNGFYGNMSAETWATSRNFMSKHSLMNTAGPWNTAVVKYILRRKLQILLQNLLYRKQTIPQA